MSSGSKCQVMEPRYSKYFTNTSPSKSSNATSVCALSHQLLLSFLNTEVLFFLIWNILFRIVSLRLLSIFFQRTLRSCSLPRCYAIAGWPTHITSVPAWECHEIKRERDSSGGDAWSALCELIRRRLKRNTFLWNIQHCSSKINLDEEVTLHSDDTELQLVGM